MQVDNIGSISIDKSVLMDEAMGLKDIIVDALKHYYKSGMGHKEWSFAYFKEQLPEKSEEEIAQWVSEIDRAFSTIKSKKESIAKAKSNGIGVDDWFARELQSSEKNFFESHNAFDTKVMLKNMGKDVAAVGAISAVNVAFELGSKMVQGEDIEFDDIVSAVVKGGSAAVETTAKTIIVSAVKVAVEKDVIKSAAKFKGASLGPVVAAVDIGLSNAKTMYKVGSEQITLKEGIYEIEVNTIAGVVCFIGASKGVAVGASVGSAFGPAGTAIGGFVGGMAGGLSGSAVQYAVAKGVQKVNNIVSEGATAMGQRLEKENKKMGVM